ncbi:MAG: hypothetical protein QOI29_2439 [Mycobacterium sp.]|jgi:hypothetical protein|nr:hypothetical protein [Mycobacterium sp.]
MLATAGCSGERIVNTSEPPAQTATAAPTAAPPTPSSNAHLVNAFNYAAHVGDVTGYYFTTPSGKWRCAILTRIKAGCQASSGWQSGLGIPGEPDSVPDAAGQATTPNAIVVDDEGDPQFVALGQPEFWLVPGPANVLRFNRILAAAGFRCNVQESGVSCQSETSGKGFTFSAEGYTPQYTDVPANAP